MRYRFSGSINQAQLLNFVCFWWFWLGFAYMGFFGFGLPTATMGSKMDIVKYFLMVSGIIFWLLVAVDYAFFKLEQRAENGE